MDKTTTLKPCPFCGGTPKRGTQAINSMVGHSVICAKCEGTGGVFIDPQEAIAAWNHRPTEQALTEQAIADAAAFMEIAKRNQALLEALKRIVSAFDTQETISEWNSSIVDAEGLLKSLGEAAS